MLQINNYIFFCLCLLCSCNFIYQDEKDKIFYQINQNLENSCNILEGKLKNLTKELDTLVSIRGNSSFDILMRTNRHEYYKYLNEIINEIKLVKKQLRNTQKTALSLLEENKRGKKLLDKIYNYLKEIDNHAYFYKNNSILLSLINEKEDYIKNQFGNTSTGESAALLTAIQFTLLDIFVLRTEYDEQQSENMGSCFVISEPILLMPQVIRKGKIVRPILFIGFQNRARNMKSNIGRIIDNNKIIFRPEKEGRFEVNIIDERKYQNNTHIYYVLPNDREQKNSKEYLKK
ncbi:MAG: hypothetical protein EAZ44_08080 [Cytophagia bacterium]|nr:MAG: hypothetical protein EAZ44_08080 [Cytophagia bacterium]TAG39002.1 MAG: hypothetical protein EAZ31_09840 [Cytophagia bacterium]